MDKRNTFESENYMTINNIQALLVVSFYTLLRPRRLEYRMLKVFENTPTDKQVNQNEDNWVVVRPKGNQNVVMVLNEYKTAKRKQRKFLGQYKKDLPDKLTSLLRQYVKKANRKNADYLFVNKNGEPYTDNKFSAFVKKSCEKVLGIPLSVNSFRHLFVSWVVQNYKKYNNDDIKQIARDVGDARLETLLNYRIAEQRIDDEGITQIHNEIIEDRRREMAKVLELEEEGSVGDVAEYHNREREDDEMSVSVGGGGGNQFKTRKLDIGDNIDDKIDVFLSKLRVLLQDLLSN